MRRMRASPPKELDESIYDMLEAIRKKPGMCIGEPSIARLDSFICGYGAGLGRSGFALRDTRNFHRFNDWIARRLNFADSTSGWSRMIRHKSRSDADAFEQFFVLLDEFKKEYAALTRLHRINRKS